jgi:uncharacterized membrane protein
MLAIALIGFADASYLTLEHYRDAIPPCTIGGCETVLTSAYSTVLGIPVSLAGAVYYLLTLIGLFAYMDSKKQAILKWTLILPILGFLASVWFFYLQAFVIHHFCEYCLGSATTSTILCAIALFIFAKYRGTDTLPE